MNNIAISAKEIERQIEELYKQLNKLQEQCLHVNASKKHGGDTGNYDLSQNCYWIDYHCQDCNKKWRVYK